MNYYNFDTMFRSLKDILCNYLKSNGIYYELSGFPSNWHFEILTDEDGAAVINQLLDTYLIWEV